MARLGSSARRQLTDSRTLASCVWMAQDIHTGGRSMAEVVKAADIVGVRIQSSKN